MPSNILYLPVNSQRFFSTITTFIVPSGTMMPWGKVGDSRVELWVTNEPWYHIKFFPLNCLSCSWYFCGPACSNRMRFLLPFRFCVGRYFVANAPISLGLCRMLLLYVFFSTVNGLVLLIIQVSWIESFIINPNKRPLPGVQSRA